MKRLGMVVLLSLLVAGCQDRGAVTAPPGGLVAAISDGAHDGGNPHFYFLPPLVEKPDRHDRDQHRPHRDLGLDAFNPNLKPVVRVFPLPGGGADGCTLTGTPVYTRVASVERRDEQYGVDWNTRASHLVPGTNYRICVFSSVAGQMLGFLDVVPVTGGMKNLRTHDTYVFQDGRTLPIKFRIEMGALCAPDALECGGAGTVTSAGGTVTLPSAHAGVAIPPGAIGAGDVVTIVIEKQAPPYGVGAAAECLPTGYELEQSKGCYHFRTEPADYGFHGLVRMEACVDPGTLDPNSLVLYKYSGGTLEQLPWADPTLLDCTGFVALNADGTNMPASLADAVWRGAGRLFATLITPRPLYATTLFGTPKGLGGLAGSFSDVGGAVAQEVALPDLAITAAPTVVPDTAIWGDPFYASVTVWNVGQANAGAFRVAFLIWCTSCEQIVPDTVWGNVPALPVGYQTTIAVQIPRCTYLSNYFYAIKAVADVDGVIDQSDYDNDESPVRNFTIVDGSAGSGACTGP